MPVTIRDIAARANVSDVTVSNVLHNKGRFGEETRKRVIRVAHEMGYRPNHAASAMNAGRYGAIGMLLSVSSKHSVLEQMINGIEEGVSSARLALKFCNLPDEELTDEDHLRRLSTELAVDGLLVNYTHEFPPPMAEIIDRYAIPSVWLNVKRDHDCVHPDDFGAAALAVDEFLRLGHKRIGYLTYEITGHSHYSVVDRRDGYIAAAVKAGLAPDMIDYWGDLPNDARDQRLMTWLNRDDRPTAVFCESVAEANCLCVAAARLGLSVPRDLSILAVQEEGAGSVGASLDSVRLSNNRVGRLAVELLQRKIDHPEKQLPPQAVPCTLDCSAMRSVAPPAGT
jgi:DNA-binding LacI/PurR family transcriptional regulator